MKILVIGGGVAKSVVSYLLGKNFDVTLIQDKNWIRLVTEDLKVKFLINLILIKI